MIKKDVLRKLTVILIAAINSEILSTSQTFSTLFLDLSSVNNCRE